MPEIDPSTVATASWAAVALVSIAILAAAIRRKWGKEDAATKQRREQYNAYVAALHEWQDYIDNGDVAAAALVKKELDAMREKGWNIQ